MKKWLYQYINTLSSMFFFNLDRAIKQYYLEDHELNEMELIYISVYRKMIEKAYIDCILSLDHTHLQGLFYYIYNLPIAPHEIWG